MKLFDLVEAKKKIRELEERNIILENEHYLDKVHYNLLDKECEGFKEECHSLRKQVKELTKKLNDEELKNLGKDRDLQKANNKSELLELQLADTKALLEEYKALPNLETMVKNLSSLTTPSIDKLIEVIQKTNSTDIQGLLTSIEKELGNLNNRIGSLEHIAGYGRFR